MAKNFTLQDINKAAEKQFADYEVDAGKDFGKVVFRNVLKLSPEERDQYGDLEMRLKAVYREAEGDEETSSISKMTESIDIMREQLVVLAADKDRAVPFVEALDARQVFAVYSLMGDGEQGEA